MAQKILGSSPAIRQDVALAKKQELVGDSCSVHLSQDANSAAVWRLEVYVHLQQGTFFLGYINSTPPSLGDIPSRTVLVATCPGATGWMVVASCGTNGEEAEIVVDSSKCCTSAIGVHKIDPNPDPSSEDPWRNTFSTALANSFEILTAETVLRSITLQIDSALATGTYYVQGWNAAALPADGTAITLVNSFMSAFKVQHVSGVDDTIRIDFNEKGVRATLGAFLCLSTTRFTKTLAAGSVMSVVSAEFEIP